MRLCENNTLPTAGKQIEGFFIQLFFGVILVFFLSRKDAEPQKNPPGPLSSACPDEYREGVARIELQLDTSKLNI
jgi:hypothetical protein